MKFSCSTFLLGLLVFFAYACKTAQTKQPTDPVHLSFVVLQKGNLYGAGDEGIIAGMEKANSSEEALTIVKKMNRINMEIDTAKLPKQEFYSESALLFIFDRVRGSGGHEIHIETFLKRNDTLIIQAQKRAPEGPATSVMTQPYVIVSIEKPTLPVELEIIE